MQNSFAEVSEDDCPDDTVFNETNDRCEKTPVCPPDSNPNPNTDKCESPPECSIGNYNSEINLCEILITPICPIGLFNPVTDQCENFINPICFEGEFNPDIDKCEIFINPICIEGELNTDTDLCEGDSAPQQPLCLTPYEYNPDTDKCESFLTPLCLTPYEYNPDIDKCVSSDPPFCATPYEYNPDTDKCESFEEFQCFNLGELNEETDLCEADFECIDGTAFDAASDLCVVQLVCIDIKPGSDPNAVNPNKKGAVPVAILGSDTFDVTTVNITTLTFGPSLAIPIHDLTHPGVYADHLQEVNGDAYTDQVSHYDQKQTGITKGDTQACLKGELNDGTLFLGCDSIKTPGK